MPLKVLIASFMLCVLPALAQEVGMKIVPLQPLVVYDSPPTGIFSGSNAIAAIAGQDNGLVTYDLQQLAGNEGFKVGAVQTVDPGSITVISTQDVAQGDTSKRWLQLDLGKARGDQSGWVLCGETSASMAGAKTGQPCQNFQLR